MNIHRIEMNRKDEPLPSGYPTFLVMDSHGHTALVSRDRAESHDYWLAIELTKPMTPREELRDSTVSLLNKIDTQGIDMGDLYLELKEMLDLAKSELHGPLEEEEEVNCYDG